MQQVKMYRPGFLKGNARDQLFRDLKKMAKAGWRAHHITHNGVGRGQVHTSQLRVLYETHVHAQSQIEQEDRLGPAQVSTLQQWPPNQVSWMKRHWSPLKHRSTPLEKDFPITGSTIS